MDRSRQLGAPSLFAEAEFPFSSLLPRKIEVENGAVPVTVWEIDQTIPTLGYLTHSYFRYYGKFPSTVAAQILEDYPPPPDGVLLDNFGGCGTSLVEASRRGIRSIGVDLNPLSTLAGKVKTERYDPKALSQTLTRTLARATSANPKPGESPWIPPTKLLSKWFCEPAVKELVALKSTLLDLPQDGNRDFLVLAFLAVIRRVSKAFDGEVRPHINKDKRQRSPFEAFAKKARDMIAIQADFNVVHPERVPAVTLQTDSTVEYTSRIPRGNYWLVISHPPYLNCFDYLPVFSLELAWSQGFVDLWQSQTLKDLRPVELRAWPAKTREFIDGYYQRLSDAYTITYGLQPRGGRCAVVIGDCTIMGRLEPVHRKLIPLMEAVGYRLEAVNYRTTHYATGKYSYEHRADYHSEDEEKRDAILVFEK